MTEMEVLWDLPLSRGLAYLHYAMMREGIETRWPAHTQTEDETMTKAFDLIRKRKEQRVNH
jgi:hypothetical protein